MISLKNVSKSFGGQTVLKDFSLDIGDCAKLAITGRSGAGKTTLLNLITGLIKPDSGEISRPEGLKISEVFQEDRLIEPLGAIKNCRLVLKKGADPSIVPNTLAALGISGELLKKPVSSLSGGERRRVAIARALVGEFDLLILDEPFKGIDSETLPSVIEEIKLRAKDKTLILVTHSKEEAAALGCALFRLADIG